MLKRACPDASPSVGPGADDLRVAITPRDADWWYGTSAQLRAEGLIPEGFEWPTGKDHRHWTVGPFEYWLIRHRPDDFKGPRMSWLTLDSWRVRRTVAGHKGSAHPGWHLAGIYAAEQALAAERFRQTSAWDREYAAWREAQKDVAYQTFRAIFIPEAKKRGRRAGGASV